MTGSELTKNILHIRPDIPVVLCTGFSELANGKQSQDIGILEITMKPYVMSKVASTIRNLITPETQPIETNSLPPGSVAEH